MILLLNMNFLVVAIEPQSHGSGGAIALYGSTLSLSSSVLLACESLQGSGGATWADAFHSLPLPSTSSSISLSSSAFSDCKSALNGGALFMSGGTLKLSSCTFDNNLAGGVVGGGGLCMNDVDADMYEYE